MIRQSTCKRWLTTGSERVTRGHATISHTDFLEGESSAFPLPTLAPLTASPSRTSSCDQGGLPPWNLRAFAPQRRETRSIRALALPSPRTLASNRFRPNLPSRPSVFFAAARGFQYNETRVQFEEA